MRILLALMFFAPLVALGAIQNGATSVTPYLVAMSVAAVAVHLMTQGRQDRA
ncbi:MAG: hypothetical protein AAGA06_03360 [Pseudomonadota bacterium]